MHDLKYCPDRYALGRVYWSDAEQARGPGTFALSGSL